MIGNVFVSSIKYFRKKYISQLHQKQEIKDIQRISIIVYAIEIVFALCSSQKTYPFLRMFNQFFIRFCVS